MATKKETTPSKPRGRDALALDIARKIEMAARDCDGHQLSDEELDDLCDTALSANGSDRCQSDKKHRG